PGLLRFRTGLGRAQEKACSNGARGGTPASGTLLRNREGRPLCRPTFLLLTRIGNDSSDGTEAVPPIPPINRQTLAKCPSRRAARRSAPTAGYVLRGAIEMAPRSNIQRR